MSKLIDSEELKAEITALFGGKILEDALLDFIDDLQPILLSCPKCHGEGEYYIPTNDIHEATFNFQPKKCLICKGTGKVTIEAYEDYQERCRGK